MNSFPSPADEVRALADAQFDGRINHEQTVRLESLIVNDLLCMQTYVERMAFHGEILKDSTTKTPAQATVTVLKEFSNAVHLRERRIRLTQFWSATVLGLGLIVVISALSIPGLFQAAPLGMVASLSSDARFKSSPFELGQVVRVGDSLTIDQGIVTLQLPDVLIDLIGPATATLDRSGHLSLNSGTIIAKMLHEGEQFKVTTPDVEVLDLGTEFLVHHDALKGTNVSVRQGRVQASLLDWRKTPTQKLELTDRRSATFQSSSARASEIDFQPEQFTPVDRSRGGIFSIDGMLRTATEQPVLLGSGKTPTFNHILVIPEHQNLVLEEDLNLDGMDGPVRIPAGSVINSYLVHYDPPGDVSRAPRGAITFFDPITAVITSSQGLLQSDSATGLPGTQYESAAFRGAELGPDEDRIQISNDRRTVSFRFDTSPPFYLDEVRILTVARSP